MHEFCVVPQLLIGKHCSAELALKAAFGSRRDICSSHVEVVHLARLGSWGVYEALLRS